MPLDDRVDLTAVYRSAAGVWDTIETASAIEPNTAMRVLSQQLWEANEGGLQVAWDSRLNEENDPSGHGAVRCSC